MINLLSLKKKNDIKTLMLLRFITGLFLAVISTAIILLASLLPIYFYLNKQEASVLGIGNNLNNDVNFSQIKTISEKISFNNEKLRIFPNELPENGYFESLLSRVVSIKGSGVSITSFNYYQPNKNDTKSTNFEIAGVASDRKSLLDFKKRLEEDDGFSEVVLPISSFVKVDNISFTIKLRTK